MSSRRFSAQRKSKVELARRKELADLRKGVECALMVGAVNRKWAARASRTLRFSRQSDPNA